MLKFIKFLIYCLIAGIILGATTGAYEYYRTGSDGSIPDVIRDAPIVQFTKNALKPVTAKTSIPAINVKPVSEPDIVKTIVFNNKDDTNNKTLTALTPKLTIKTKTKRTKTLTEEDVGAQTAQLRISYTIHLDEVEIIAQTAPIKTLVTKVVALSGPSNPMLAPIIAERGATRQVQNSQTG